MAKYIEPLIGKRGFTGEYTVKPFADVRQRAQKIEELARKNVRVLVRLRSEEFIEQLRSVSGELIQPIKTYLSELDKKTERAPKGAIVWLAPAGRIYKKALKKYLADPDHLYTFEPGKVVELRFEDALVALRTEPCGLGYLLEEVDGKEEGIESVTVSTDELEAFRSWREKKSAQAAAKKSSKKSSKKTETPAAG